MGYKGTNFSLSKDEQDLLSNTTFFKSKIALTGRITEIFGALEDSLHEAAAAYPDRIPAAALQKRGKISRGENYQGLPYLVLDHPAVFEKDGIFAFRTMMWWGHPFTCTFHISGKYLAKIDPAISGIVDLESPHPVYVCVNENQWVHHLEQTNYVSANDFLNKNPDLKKYSESKGFLKLMIQIPIHKTELLEESAVKFFKSVLDHIH